MNKTLQQWAERIDARTLRERLLIFGAAALGVFLVINTLALDPLTARRKALLQTLEEHHSRMEASRAQIQALVAARSVDPDAALRARIAALKARHAEQEARLAAFQEGLIRAERMRDVLRDLLARNRNVRLVALRSLAPEPVGREGAKIDADKALLWRQGVEITVEGSFADLLAYVDAIEALPWRLLLGKTALAVQDYPRSRLTLTLYTLSLDRTWLSV